jgi:hypothetical protein
LARFSFFSYPREQKRTCTVCLPPPARDAMKRWSPLLTPPPLKTSSILYSQWLRSTTRPAVRRPLFPAQISGGGAAGDLRRSVSCLSRAGRPTNRTCRYFLGSPLADRRLNRVFSALLCCLKCMAGASFSLLLQNAGAIARGHKCQSYCSRGSPVLCSCVLG